MAWGRTSLSYWLANPSWRASLIPTSIAQKGISHRAATTRGCFVYMRGFKGDSMAVLLTLFGDAVSAFGTRISSIRGRHSQDGLEKLCGVRKLGFNRAG